MSKVEPVKGVMSEEKERKKFVEKNKQHMWYQSTLVKVGDKPAYLSDSMTWINEKDNYWDKEKKRFNFVTKCTFLPASNVYIGDTMVFIKDTDINPNDEMTMKEFMTLWGVDRVSIINEMLPNPKGMFANATKGSTSKQINGMTAKFSIDLILGQITVRGLWRLISKTIVEEIPGRCLLCGKKCCKFKGKCYCCDEPCCPDKPKVEKVKGPGCCEQCCANCRKCCKCVCDCIHFFCACEASYTLVTKIWGSLKNDRNLYSKW